MYITKVIIDKYKRFYLNDIRHFEYTPKSQMQLIVGRNGSGKTSLLEAIIKQPANKADYEKGGRNEIHFNHGNYSYILINDFSQGAKYSFLRKELNSNDDYEDLNPSRLITLQKELYIQTVNISDEIADMLVGNTTFTNMSVSKRRDWFNLMHTTDTSFVNKVYQVIRSRLRDMQGAVKSIGEKLALERNNIPNTNEIDSLITEKGQLEKQSHLYAIAYNENLQGGHSEQLEQTRQLLIRNNQQAERLFNSNDLKGIYYRFNPNEITNSITKLTQQTIEYQTSLKLKIKQLDELRVELLTYVRELSIEEIKFKIEEAKENLTKAELHYLKEIDLTYNSAQLQLNTIDAIKQDCINILDFNYEITGDYDAIINVRELDQLSHEYDALLKTKGSIETQLFTLREKQTHYNQHQKDNIDCPKCHYSFNPFLKNFNINEVIDKITTLETDLENCEIKLNTLNVQFKNDTAKCERNRAIANKLHYYDIDEIKPYVINKTLSQARLFIEQYFNNMTNYILQHDYRKQLKKLEDMLFMASGKNEEEQLKLSNKEQVLITDIEYIQENLNIAESELRLYKNIMTQYNDIITLGVNTQENVDQLESILFKEYQYDLNTKIYEKWTATNKRLALITHRLHEIEMKKGIISEYEKTLTELNDNISIYANLSNVLSPQDGLIAEQSTTFINHFIMQLNGIIERVFNYDLIVEPCDLEEGDLNYRFKVTGGGQLRPDVSTTSDGQKEIINFAFKLLAYQHLHLENIPFINDELGRAFDEHHKQVSVNYLKDLIVTDMFEQFFLISHHATSYTTLVDAEVVVLDPNNIILPDVYNTQVIIE